MRKGVKRGVWRSVASVNRQSREFDHNGASIDHDRSSRSLWPWVPKAAPDIHELARWSVVAAIEKQRMEALYREFLKKQVEERLKEKARILRAPGRKQEEKFSDVEQAQKDRLTFSVRVFLTAIAEKGEILVAFEENQRAIRLMEEEKIEIAKKKARSSRKLRISQRHEVRRVMDQTQAQAWAEQRQRGLDERRWEAQQRAIEKQRTDLARDAQNDAFRGQAIVRTGSRSRRDDAAEIMRRENQELLEQAKTERSQFFARLHLRKAHRWGQCNERIQLELRELAPIRSAADRANVSKSIQVPASPLRSKNGPKRLDEIRTCLLANLRTCGLDPSCSATVVQRVRSTLSFARKPPGLVSGRRKRMDNILQRDFSELIFK
eukprot:Skav210347  [mRNA]  locus=scaffold4443:167978:175850:- [translate_table: standard]